MRAGDVTRIAHLSDVHMLDPRPSRTRSGYSMGVRFLSIGRPLDAEARKKKLVRALRLAMQAGAQHYVLSGDLTETGASAELEAFAEALHDSGIAPDCVTLVPGNHDAYASPDAWTRALDGPLRAFAKTSASASNATDVVVERGDVCFVPLDVTRHQAVTRSAGAIDAAVVERLSKRVTDAAHRGRAVVLVAHHPPFSHASAAWQWIDGMKGGVLLMALLARLGNLYALHGHLHHVVDRVVGFGRTRIFGAPAIVGDRDEQPRVRLYDLRGGELCSAGLAAM